METPKGVRDFLPEQKILRNEIVTTLTKYFELYGYNPIETPALELHETMASKYAGGAEILKETYSLVDNGKRKLSLRYDLTVPFARVIGMHPELKFPFKRYHIDRVWRDGPIKLGRYREFWQCDCDIAGATSLLADAELLAMASHVFTDLKLKTVIYVNNRKILNAMLSFAGVDESVWTAAILAIDKLKKIGQSGVNKELTTLGLSREQLLRLEEVLSIKGTNKQIIKTLSGLFEDKTGVEEMSEVLTYLDSFGCKKIVLDISLARGLTYYTSTFYEAFLVDSPIKSSIASGGRYDTMIGKLSGRNQEVPAVGISFGLDVLSDAMSESCSKKSQVQLYVVPIKAQKECIPLIQELRTAGIRVDSDMKGKGVSKNLQFANYYEIPFVLIVGEDELKSGKYTLRDMKSGEESKVSIAKCVKDVLANQ